jgi:hypothetical protein
VVDEIFYIFLLGEKRDRKASKVMGTFGVLLGGWSHGKHERNARHALVCCLFVFLAALALAGGTSVRWLCCSRSRPRRRWQGWLLPRRRAVQRALLPACLPCLFHAPYRRHILRRSDGSWSKKEKRNPWAPRH